MKTVGEKNGREIIFFIKVPFLQLPVAAGQHIQAPPTNTTSFDTPSLWIPQCCYGNDSRDAVSTATHEAWITSLVTSLLECGGVTDQVLLLVKPVCQVKVSSQTGFTRC